MAIGDDRPDVLVVTKFQPYPRMIDELNKYLDEAGVPTRRAFTGTLKCKSEAEPTKKDVKTCAEYLEKEVELLKPKGVLLIGNEPLLAMTGRVGIMKYRARVTHHSSGAVMFPTISPAMVKRNPGQRAGFIADLEFFARAMSGESAPTALPEHQRLVMSAKGCKTLRDALEASYGVAYDIETNGFDEFAPGAVIATISVTLWDKGFKNLTNWVLPLAHPESPWVGKWQQVFRAVFKPLYCKGHKRRVVVAHNGKFDGRWTKHFGVPLPLTFDTMLAAHVLDENRPKGLKPLAQSLLGVEPWDIDATRCMETPLRKVAKYNGLDTWWTAHLYHFFRKQLKEQPRLDNINRLLMVPASNVFTDIERAGIWCDPEKLATRAKVSADNLAAIDEFLYSTLPPVDEWPEKFRKRGHNFNPSDFQKWWLFEHLGYPILDRTEKGAPSTAEATMLKLLDMHPDDEVLKKLIERAKWQKYSSSFFSAYQELVDDNDHIHTTFKLTGTVTGRLSSGKGDETKIMGRVSNRGVNLQQVPRDQFVRGIFGAPPGWLFLECDYSQVELRVAAFLAQEKTMLHLYNNGIDIHTKMATSMVGGRTPTKEERKKAKAVNFGFLYGMGWRKFIDTAWANYGVKVTEAEAQAFRKLFFTEFSMLPEWHNRQRRLVRKYKRVESPIGRVRHLPDIDSADEGVQAEAQRQSINSPVQSFASDMCVLSLILLTRELKRRGLRSRSVGTIHDAINLVVPAEEAPEVIPLIRETMQNLPLEKLFGVHLNVPIEADVKVGRYWGDTIEMDNDISESPERTAQFIRENREKLGL